MTASSFANRIRTWTLLAALAGLLVGLGGLLGGTSGMMIALVFAVLLNGIVFWKSDTLALKANGARELRPDELPRLREIVGELARQAGIPAPRLYIVERPEPNAFATGRDPRHSAVAVTRGILELMDERQLTGVLAHELNHVKNRDTLVGTVAATLGGAVIWVAQVAQVRMFFGGDEGRNPLGAIAAMLLAPIAALIVQLAVSRGREYLADRSGAELTGDPDGLAAALQTLDAEGQQRGLVASLRGRRGTAEPAMNPAFAHPYITNPLRASELGGLFSTHPPIAERIARLRAMRANRLARPLDGRPGV